MAYFDLFPRVAYDIDGKRRTKFDSVTNIFFRLRVIREVLGNISAYYEHTISDGETPEILAEKVYRDAGAYWIILMANDIVDPQYDWPLDDRSFRKYIVNKYGSIANAKSTYHHYEKVIERTESFSGLTTETRFIINETNFAKVQGVDVPYDSYTTLGSTVVLYDDFETFSGWNTRGDGDVSQSSTRSYKGLSSAYKTLFSDPNGAAKNLAFPVQRNWRLECWIYPEEPRVGGSNDRISIQSSSREGYGIRVGPTDLAIEARRFDGNADIASTPHTRVGNVWYRAVLSASTDNTFTATLYDIDGNIGASVTSPPDTSVSGPFEQVAILGGFNYNVDELKVTTFDGISSLPETQSVETFNMPNDRTVTQITRRDRISNWDYERELNEQKRLIKVIKPEYYTQIVEEFNSLTNYARSPFLRRLI